MVRYRPKGQTCITFFIQQKVVQNTKLYRPTRIFKSHFFLEKVIRKKYMYLIPYLHNSFTNTVCRTLPLLNQHTRLFLGVIILSMHFIYKYNNQKKKMFSCQGKPALTLVVCFLSWCHAANLNLLQMWVGSRTMSTYKIGCPYRGMVKNVNFLIQQHSSRASSILQKNEKYLYYQCFTSLYKLVSLTVLHTSFQFQIKVNRNFKVNAKGMLDFFLYFIY